MAKSTDEALEKIIRANPLADMLELRLDVMESFRLEDMVRVASKPVIVTYRSKKEGGNGSANYETQTRYLFNALEADADFVDVEYSMPLEFRRKIFRGRRRSKIIASVHLLNGTPSKEKLEEIFRNLATTGADIMKIVTRAQLPEDNLRVLGLIPQAQKMDVEIIAFCMGPIGRISRIASLLFGGYLTFASLEEGEESADGQIPVAEMRKILEKFCHDH
ncbi:MAG: type I 3-dehydroquinate dehydratase [Deltaproteobacteria bacterium]|nr:MAG: type I 3-dehydroquinate dehydratase [Deltaproteobacteria bacterium]